MMLWITMLLGTSQAETPDSVTMTLGEFLQLYESSKTRPEKPEKAPRAYALSRARYDGRVVIDDGEPVSALFKATLTVEVLKKKGWVRVPLLDGAVAVQKARIGSFDAPVVLENGTYVLVTDKKGRFDVEVEFAVSVKTEGGSSGFSFPMQPSGATEMTLTVPTDVDLDFTVANSRLKQDRVQGANRVVEATLPATGSLAVNWQREIDKDEGAEQARVYSEVHTLVAIGDGLVRATATVNQTILFAGVDEMKVAVPKDFTVLDVRGNGLRDWSMGTDGTLTVDLNYEAEGAYPLVIDLEKVLTDGPLAAPVVKPLGVERSKGWLGVRAIGALEIEQQDVENAAVVDVRTLPASILGVSGTPVLLGFKYIGDTATIPLQVSEHEEVDVLVTLLDKALGTTMFTLDGRRLTSVRYQVRNNRRQFLRLKLPDGAELWSASVAGRAVQPAQSGGRLLVPLIRSAASGGALAAFEVEVVYVESGAGPGADGKGSFTADLPTADAPTTYVAWTIYVPQQAKIKKHEGSLRHVDHLSGRSHPETVLGLDSQYGAIHADGQLQVNTGGLGQGAAPVQVNLPLEGRQVHFEKVLALEERLWISFSYKGLKQK